MQGDEPTANTHHDRYHLLTNEHTRETLRALTQTDETTHHHLADHLVTTYDIPQSQAMVTLWHTTLPKLADAGLITYDTSSGEVTVVDSERIEALVGGMDAIDSITGLD